MNPRQTEIQRAIAKIKNIYPPDDLITTYKDFLKHRDVLDLYQFNPRVFNALVNLTHSLWRSKNRINRYSLINITKKYFTKSEQKHKLPSDITAKLFFLFKSIVLDEDIDLSIKTIEKMKYPINNMLKGIRLTNKEVEHLILNSQKSDYALNRVLRYPFPNKLISNWARENYNRDLARPRRAEISSWLLDEDWAFEIDKETLILDFEYLNKLERGNFEKYTEEMEFFKLVNDEINPVFSPEMNLFDYSFDMLHPVLKQIKRFYGTAISKDFQSQDWKLDIKELEKHFYSSIENIYSISMAWSIAYSRLNNKRKTVLLKKYYSTEIYWTYFKIAKRIKSVELLEWLKNV